MCGHAICAPVAWSMFSEAIQAKSPRFYRPERRLGARGGVIRRDSRPGNNENAVEISTNPRAMSTDPRGISEAPARTSQVPRGISEVPAGNFERLGRTRTVPRGIFNRERFSNTNPRATFNREGVPIEVPPLPNEVPPAPNQGPERILNRRRPRSRWPERLLLICAWSSACCPRTETASSASRSGTRRALAFTPVVDGAEAPRVISPRTTCSCRTIPHAARAGDTR
jgi:hypothetical protein